MTRPSQLRRPHRRPQRILAGTLLAAAAVLLAGCGTLNRRIDAWALESKADAAVERPLPAALSPLPFQSDLELERLTRPAGPARLELAAQSRYRLDEPHLVQEELSFDSALPLRLPGSQRAVAHLYRQGPLGERPVLLWVPGQAIQASDFPSLSEYFGVALARGYDVVFYVPPYHLERSPESYASGDAFLATDFADHLAVFAQELSDLRRLTVWLRARGVRTLGAFGSSMGGGLLLKLVSWDDSLDFLVLKQPLIDWNSVIRLPPLAAVRGRLADQGVSDEQMTRAYLALDARWSRPRLPPERIALLYGLFDGIALPDRSASLARLWGVRRVSTYRRGHSLITLGGGTYREVGRVLEEERQAAGWDSGPPRAPRATGHRTAPFD